MSPFFPFARKILSLRPHVSSHPLMSNISESIWSQSSADGEPVCSHIHVMAYFPQPWIFSRSVSLPSGKSPRHQINRALIFVCLESPVSSSRLHSRRCEFIKPDAPQWSPTWVANFFSKECSNLEYLFCCLTRTRALSRWAECIHGFLDDVLLLLAEGCLLCWHVEEQLLHGDTE